MLTSAIMSTNIITVLPSANIQDIASTLYKNRISAVPVVDTQQRLLGIVSEGDLVYRKELGTEHQHSWWISLLVYPERRVNDYIKSHAETARDIMTKHVISVTEATPVQEIADLLERHRIKRVPVLRDDKMVGIVSRANLVQSLVVGINESTSTGAHKTDLSIRDTLVNNLHDELGIPTGSLNIIVKEGVVHVWGFVDSHLEQKAIQIAAESVEGVKSVVNRLALYSNIPGYGI